MKGLVDSVKNLCKHVDMVEGVVNTLRADLNDIRGKAPMGSDDMSLLEEAMQTP